MSSNQKERLRTSAHLARRPSYSLVVDDVLVFPGHPGSPLPGLLVQTVLLRRPRLRLQLTTLMDKHRHAHVSRRHAGLDVRRRAAVAASEAEERVTEGLLTCSHC